MKRRGQSGPAEPPPEQLARFVYSEWIDESETPPSWWERPDVWPTWRHIRAYQRYLAEARAWRAAHGVSFDQWQAMRRQS